MRTRCRGAFTLVELLVVMAIIGILAAALGLVFGGAGESGRAAKCRSNMRQLAQACYSCAMEEEYKRYPFAETCVALDDDGIHVYELRGWISGLSKGMFTSSGKGNAFSAVKIPGVFSREEEIRYAYSHGAIWNAIDGNKSCFLCPTMMNDKRAKKGRQKLAWCYVMSARFHYDWSRGSEPTESTEGGLRLGNLAKPDRTLMFAELCLDDLGGGDTGDTSGDMVLEYGDGSKMLKERMGFPHRLKQGYCGFVAFADGHVESYMKPSNGKTAEQNLTKWLCQGYDVTYDSDGTYSKIDDSVDDGSSDSSDDE